VLREVNAGIHGPHPDMTFEWKPSPDSRRAYLLKKQVDGKPNDREIERVIEELMMQGPAKKR
jgi:hypothetical protein